MKTATNTRNIKVGDIVKLNKNSGPNILITVTRVDEKSWYGSYQNGAKARKGFGIIEEWIKGGGYVTGCEIIRA